VIPSSHHLLLAAICEQTGRKLVLADEDEIREVFKDCDVGAIPPVAMAYGMHTYLDDILLKQPDIYFEAGDHQELVHMNIDQFADLMADAERGHFARRVT
jgi:Ala-tRNA(Pro) deacylase